MLHSNKQLHYVINTPVYYNQKQEVNSIQYFFSVVQLWWKKSHKEELSQVQKEEDLYTSKNIDT